ncbi:MAG TPA: DUF507 family protein [Nitrospinota bacterium]|jgi:hypothetical protein|nr:hypothetical protein [Anaerolineaceae bacterium]HJM83571.1 DUF507 family protein [Nitrospinota bacterium]|tara:strand:- start:386 stop:667 length:282 start_codon:yes stop_codon:yes gene_type:complete
MKLNKEMIDYLSKQIVVQLEEKGLIETGKEQIGVRETVSGIITNDLLVEDKLNDEVKILLEEMGDELDKKNINYRKMFQLVKQKLARERGLIL